jgi:hypothetical protein
MSTTGSRARLHRFLAAELEIPPAPGLAEAVRAAHRDHAGDRRQLHLTPDQMEPVAYRL